MADHKKVIGLMEATGVEIGRLQAWSEMFARSENHNLVAVATGLQYLVLVNTDDRTECFRDNGFSPVARDVYDWMVREKKVDYACLAAHGFVIIEEEACATDGEETLSIVNMRKANAAAMPAIDIEFMRTVDYRIGPECMANLRPKEPECVQLTEHLTFREAQSVVEYAVQEVVSGGRAEKVDPDVENLKWFVADDVIESFRNAKGLPALGMTHSVSLISMGHYLTKHCGGADIPVGTHGYCYLDGFKYEMQQPVFINSGELPLLMMVIPWYALAVRYGLAIPVNVTTGGDVCHFSVDDAGDVFGSLKRMLALVAETKHIRVGFITSSFVPGYVREHTVRTLVPRCECGVQAESLIPADVSDTADAETGHVLVAWLAKPLLGCKYQLTTPGVYNVDLHAGRLTVETGVAIVTVPRRMCVTLNGGAMVDTRDTFGSVRLLCIGGFEFVTDNVLDHADVQIVVGSKSDFQAWFSAYVDDTPHFPGLVNERGIGVYAWSETTRTKSRPVAVWSKVIGTEAVVLLTGGLRVGFPFNLRLCLSSYVDVVRPELGTIRKENVPVCYKSYDLDEFPYYTGVAFSQWLHSQMGGDDCNMCFGVRKGL